MGGASPRYHMMLINFLEHANIFNPAHQYVILTVMTGVGHTDLVSVTALLGQ